MFWKFFKGKDKAGKEKTVPMLRYHKVFNYEQCENLDAKYSGEKEVEGNDIASEPLEAANKMVDSYEDAPRLAFGGGRAYYSPTNDVVQMPPIKSFRNGELYFKTLAHEMAHSTGHKERLDRQFGTSFGNEDYSREELVAEFSAAMLMAHSDLDVSKTAENTEAYLRSWLKHLEDNPSWLVWAGSRASKATNHILGIAEETK